MQANANTAVKLFEAAQSKVQTAQAAIEKAKLGMELANISINNFNTKVQAMSWFERSASASSIERNRNTLVSTFNNYHIQYDAAQTKLAKAKLEATDKKSDAYALIGVVNSGIERVLSITSDLAVITYVAGVADRVDSIARATREAVANLQGRLVGVEAALLYDEPIMINLVPAITPIQPEARAPRATQPAPIPVYQPSQPAVVPGEPMYLVTYMDGSKDTMSLSRFRLLMQDGENVDTYSLV